MASVYLVFFLFVNGESSLSCSVSAGGSDSCNCDWRIHYWKAVWDYCKCFLVHGCSFCHVASKQALKV
ncbi:unnamed protein product [Victoria cruziana]